MGRDAKPSARDCRAIRAQLYSYLTLATRGGYTIRLAWRDHSEFQVGNESANQGCRAVCGRNICGPPWCSCSRFCGGLFSPTVNDMAAQLLRTYHSKRGRPGPNPRVYRRQSRALGDRWKQSKRHSAILIAMNRHNDHRTVQQSTVTGRSGPYQTSCAQPFHARRGDSIRPERTIKARTSRSDASPAGHRVSYRVSRRRAKHPHPSRPFDRITDSTGDSIRPERHHQGADVTLGCFARKPPIPALRA